MTHAIPLMLVVTAATGAEITPRPADENQIAGLQSAVHSSTAANHSTKDLSAMVTTPTTPLELIKNCKFVFDHYLLLRDDFYTDAMIKYFFGGNTVTWWPGTQGKAASVSDFGGMVKPYMINGLNLAIHFKVSKKINLSTGKAKGTLTIIFADSNQDLIFEQIEFIFGKSWKPIIDFAPPSHWKMVHVPTHPHGNNKIKYVFDDEKMHRLIGAEFNSDGTLYNVQFVEEEQ